MVLLLTGLCAGADTPLWEPGKLIAVEQVSTPAKTPDSSCLAVPKGATPPARCRPSNLRAQQYWRVTVEVGNKRFVVRPYRAPNLIESLSQDGVDYVDPKLTEASSVEVAVLSSKTVRLRSDQGPGIPAMVDSQELLSNREVPQRAAATLGRLATPAAPGPKVVLLENSDFRDLEVQEFKSQDIGDGALLYSFTGDSSRVRIGSNAPVFLALAENESTVGGDVLLARLQVAKGTRQLVYSQTNHRAASSQPITVTQVSETVRKLNMREPLSPGEYVVLWENSNRGFLFSVH
jgi:hypothetical protein